MNRRLLFPVKEGDRDPAGAVVIQRKCLFLFLLWFQNGLPRWCSGKESVCQCRRHGFHPWVGKILWRRDWQPTPVFLPGEFHGQRSLAGYSPWGHKELDLTEWLTLSFKELMALDISLKWYWRTNNKLPKISWLSPQAETCLSYHSFLYYDWEYTQIKRHG